MCAVNIQNDFILSKNGGISKYDLFSTKKKGVFFNMTMLCANVTEDKCPVDFDKHEFLYFSNE